MDLVVKVLLSIPVLTCLSACAVLHTTEDQSGVSFDRPGAPFSLAESPDSPWPLIEVSYDVPPGDEGTCNVRFDVTEDGRVDINTTDATCDPARRKKLARRVLSGFRFDPLIDNGHPIKRHDVVAQIRFEAEDLDGVTAPPYVGPLGGAAKNNGAPNDPVGRQF